MSEGLNTNYTWSIPTSFAYASIHSNVYIGGYGSNRFYGYIAHLRVWSRERQQIETQFDTYRRLYSGSSLLYIWNFNEGTGNTATEYMQGNLYLQSTGSSYNWSVPPTPPPLCGQFCYYDGIKCRCKI